MILLILFDFRLIDYQHLAKEQYFDALIEVISVHEVD